MANSLRDEKAKALADHVTEAVRKRRDGKDGKDGQLIVQTDDAAVRALKEEFATLKAQALQPDNDSKAIPIAIGRLGEEFQKLRQQLDSVLVRLDDLEREPRDITPSEPAELQENIDSINEKVADIAKAMLTDLLEHNQRIETLETRVQNMPRRLLELYQNELKSIA